MTLTIADRPSLFFRPALPPGLLDPGIVERARALVAEQRKMFVVAVEREPDIEVLSVTPGPAAFRYTRCQSPPALLQAAAEFAHFWAEEELGVEGASMGFFETFAGRGAIVIRSDTGLLGVALTHLNAFWISAAQDAESAVQVVAHEVHHLQYVPLHPGAGHEEKEAAASAYARTFSARHGSQIMQLARLAVANPPIIV